jgi:adenylate kinase
MRVALTGTPGTGKTEVGNILKSKGNEVRNVRDLAAEFRAASETDEGLEIDVEVLTNSLPDPEETIVIEGHLAHLLPNDICIVLRCNPNVLRDRLEARGYSEEKVRENMEAEAIDLILVEALDNCVRVFEIDTSDLESDRVADAIENVIKGNADSYSPGNVDWSQVVMDWY